MFQRILLAVDGSEASQHAARAAGRLAATLKAEVTVLTVTEPVSDALGEPNYSNAVNASISAAESFLAGAAAAVVEEGGPTPVLDRLEGRAGDAILTAAAAGGCDLIVMGNRGRGRIATAFLGSVSTAVVTRARIPVLVIPHLVD
jgi:nucleotide-binding universal stress UspA family protein